MTSILIVDDDNLLCRALSEELSARNFLVSYSSDPDKALDMLQNISFDVILLDLMMPGKDGFFFLRHFREQRILSKVIVLTAFANINTALEAAKLGANEFISKPYEIEDLLLTIEKVLQPA